MEIKIKEKSKRKFEIKGEKIYQEILENVEQNDVEIVLERKDFVKKLSTNFGVGYQDMKKKYKYASNLLMNNKNLDVSFLPTEIYSLDNIGIKITIKKK